jgi:hypothetical protein
MHRPQHRRSPTRAVWVDGRSSPIVVQPYLTFLYVLPLTSEYNQFYGMLEEVEQPCEPHDETAIIGEV